MNEFLITCRQLVVGATRRLEDALNLAKERAEREWQDLVVWRGAEVLAVVTAGGDVQQLSGAWTTVDGPEPDVLIDLDLCNPAVNP